MSTNRHIDKICIAVIPFLLILTLAAVSLKTSGVLPAAADMGYESRIFDTSRVHTIDIEMDDWNGFLETCENEEYSECSVVIDNETYKNVGIRAKGNTSLSSVKKYGNNRYSFKIEFDCYDSGKSYHGLDKISLNNIIQDNTYMKDYLCYQMMGYFDVAAPLCSYAYITVNGDEWGLYLAVEAVEESFLERNYGKDAGELYKPDSMDMGGGRGNGGMFNEEEFKEGDMPEEGMEPPEGGTMPEGGMPPERTMPEEGMEPPEGGTMPEGEEFRGGGQMPASDDVSLIYSDDEYLSYSNIFDNAKTDITDKDKDRLIASIKILNEGEDISEAVDINQVIRYFVVHNFVCNFDSYTGSMMHNYYLYEKDGQLSMIPWDYNLAFGGFESGADAAGLINYPIDTPVSGGDISSRPMLSWIFGEQEYTEMYHAYFDEFIKAYFNSGVFSETLSRVFQMIAPYVERDPTKFCTYEEFEAGAEALEKFCILRAESIAGQIDGRIPSTEEGQKADSSPLVDAGSLLISDMGTMQ